MANIQHADGVASFRGKWDSSDQDKKFPFRFLIPAKVANIIIGTAGERIQRLRKECNSRLSIPDSKGPERLFLIESTIEDCIKVWSDCFPDLKGIMGSENRKIPEEMDLRFLCHSSIVGSIIGKGGSKVQDYRTTYQLSRIKVYCEHAPMSTDRVIQIIASPDKIFACLRVLIADLMTQNIRGPVDNYNPDNYNEQLAPTYGGWLGEPGVSYGVSLSLGEGETNMQYEHHAGNLSTNTFESSRNISFSAAQFERAWNNAAPVTQYDSEWSAPHHPTPYETPRNSVPYEGGWNAFSDDHCGLGRDNLYNNGWETGPVPQSNNYERSWKTSPPANRFERECSVPSEVNTYEGGWNAANRYDGGWNGSDRGRNMGPPRRQYNARGRHSDDMSNRFERGRGQFCGNQLRHNNTESSYDCDTKDNHENEYYQGAQSGAPFRRPYHDDRASHDIKKPRPWNNSDEFGDSDNYNAPSSAEPNNVDVIVPDNYVCALEGNGGEKMDNIMKDSGAKIVIRGDVADTLNATRVINIIGTKDQIEGAQYLMQMCVKRSMLNLTHG